MFDDYLRTTKDRLFERAARGVGPILHPTGITLVAFGAGLIGVGLLFQQQYGAALFFWLLNRILDGLDGTMARVHGQQSDLGGYLDILADFTIYALVPVGLVLGMPSQSNLIALAFLLTSFYINAASWMYLAAILEKRRQGAITRGERTAITMPGGLIGGTETFVLFCLFILLPQWLVPLFALMAALVGVTIVQRLRWSLTHLRR